MALGSGALGGGGTVACEAVGGGADRVWCRRGAVPRSGEVERGGTRQRSRGHGAGWRPQGRAARQLKG